LKNKSDYFSDIKVDLVEQIIPKLSYFDPSDTHGENFKGKYAHLVFHLDTTIISSINDICQVNTDPFSRKAFLGI
jgi:predicted oxidoreductase (fatty acid repression mutant protein)